MNNSCRRIFIAIINTQVAESFVSARTAVVKKNSFFFKKASFNGRKAKHGNLNFVAKSELGRIPLEFQPASQ
jgi:hypothetical protein